ncbi:hypothetical protein QFC21_001082 [Naganishia friedmannii]|uniref:Uncharacterized protein n=1 Tax=Naganishia friedmannii TaxID=89922 RepID=A0ACC2W958_9TREE|nr:hypothetical protein QFC21_001082 [Naganishia friedmannii]
MSERPQNQPAANAPANTLQRGPIVSKCPEQMTQAKAGNDADLRAAKFGEMLSKVKQIVND